MSGGFDEPAGKLVRHFRGEIEADDTDLASGSKLAAALLEPCGRSFRVQPKPVPLPHNRLHYVPFSASWYVPAGDDARPRQYLKDALATSRRSPSASYLAYLARTAPPRQYGASWSRESNCDSWSRYRGAQRRRTRPGVTANSEQKRPAMPA